MEQKAFEKVYELVDLIKETSEYKELIESTKKMQLDNDFIILSNAYINNQEEYRRLQSLNLDLKEITKELSNSKEKLFNLEVVKVYLNKLEIVNNMLNEISTYINKGVGLDESC